MAYIGGCKEHGQYLNRCDGCRMESIAREVIVKIKAGIDPDEALEIVRAEYKTNKHEADRKAQNEKLAEHLKGEARDKWIRDNLPENLRPKNTVFN